jgi:hypothetical protein
VSAKPDLDVRSPTVNFDTAQRAPLDRGLRIEKRTQKTYSLLRQFSCSLILAVPQKFNDSSLIRCEASDFFDDLADKSGTLRQVTFGSGDAGLAFNGCGFL